MSLEIAIKKHLPSFDLDVSFTASRGVFGLLGASGCGKTMTMRCIAGIESPDEGHIVVNDEVFFDSETGINLSAQQRKTALLFQNYMLFPNLTVADNVAAGIPRQLPAEALSSTAFGWTAAAGCSGPYVGSPSGYSNARRAVFGTRCPLEGLT